MAACCNNTVTPRMIKAGNVSVGDKIQLEDFYGVSKEAPAGAEIIPASSSGNAAFSESSSGGEKANEADLKEAAAEIFAESSAIHESDEAAEKSVVEKAAAVAGSGAITKSGADEKTRMVGLVLPAEASGLEGGIKLMPSDGFVRQNPSEQGSSAQSALPQNQSVQKQSLQNQSAQNHPEQNLRQPKNTGHWYESPLYGVNAANSGAAHFDPIPYSQMTNYMDNVSMSVSSSQPYIITPHDPMTPDGYEEEIDYQSVQALNGFLRTQIGRYMRIEQLIGSNTIQDRYGFLVGVGSNFIILQEITTGNIMVLDIFSVRLTYVYYSPPVIPGF